MISFALTEEQEVVREAMHEYAEKSLRPLARSCDEAEAVPAEFLDESWQLGLVGTQIPEAYGGAGEPRSPVTHALVLEELAWGDASLALAALAPALFATALVEFGTEEQKRTHLPAFAGERFHGATLALMEPGPSFDVTGLRTRAEPKGEGGYVLSGTKCLVPLGDRAGWLLVLARNGRGEAGDGIGAFLVSRDAPGVTLAAPEPKLGLRALPTATLELERVEVPAGARLGGEAGADTQRLVDLSRTALAAALLGVSRAVLEYAIPYAQERVAFGKASARKQAIAFKLAEMRMETDAMRWLVWKAASRLEQGRPATREARLAQLYAARQAMKIADEGVQVLGGHGFIREHPVEMWYRNARTLGVLEGAATV